MKYLITLIILVAAVKTSIFILLQMLKRQPKSKLFAEDLIAKDLNSRSKEQLEREMDTYKRATVSLLASNVSKKFTYMMQNVKLKREEILIIKKYLEASGATIEKKIYKNDAHIIHSYIKSTDVPDEVLLKIMTFMGNLENEYEEKKALRVAYKERAK